MDLGGRRIISNFSRLLPPRASGLIVRELREAVYQRDPTTQLQIHCVFIHSIYIP